LALDGGGGLGIVPSPLAVGADLEGPAVSGRCSCSGK